VNVELFGIARARAGVERVAVDAATLGDALRAAASACPGLVPEVISADGRLTENFLASLNGERFVSDPALALADDDTLLVLGAHAGG
jgi:molybdopterin converting factor small subunit